ncbi:glycosyltransferase family 2 protein [Pedobacter agri]|uniref:glycosyltransferase family 2 protein n=1 Tax=Pedobacter agri TaxID=454586 RepID=UPI0027827EA8|nr:glycosyltransferase family 2 protein [Pedobacter agri]MDQ1141126.1 GT2 family glycosyltransferase [Pedobacter agri]
MIEVSVIIVNYNTKDLLRQCLKSLYENTSGVSFEVILSDNQSVDGSLEMLHKYFPKVICIENKDNLGFGKANNAAIKIAKGKYLFLLNTDTYFLNNAIKILFDFMEMKENQSIGCCGGDLFDKDGNKQASYGNFPTLLDAVSQLGFYKFYKRYYETKITGGVLNQDQTIKKVDYVCGADMFIRTTVLNEVGLFDEDFFLYFEETELSYRMTKAGYNSILVPSAKIVHLEGGSQASESFNFFKIKVFSKSRKLYFKKTKGFTYAILVNWIFALQSLIMSVLKLDSNYLKKMKIILKA